MTTHWLAVAVPTPAHSGLGEPLTYRAEAPLPPGSTHIFNLGHGISQFTPPEHVAHLVDEVHAHSRQLRTA